MVVKYFAIYDSKLQGYMKPFSAPKTGQAVRSFIDVVNDPKSEFHGHPEDYTLFEIGEFDDETGKFANQQTPISLGVALHFIKEKQ